jgi:hypothetical protein
MIFQARLCLGLIAFAYVTLTLGFPSTGPIRIVSISSVAVIGYMLGIKEGKVWGWRDCGQGPLVRKELKPAKGGPGSAW